jgi:hypothetical protein
MAIEPLGQKSFAGQDASRQKKEIPVNALASHSELIDRNLKNDVGESAA